MLALDLIQDAAHFLKDRIRHTPLVPSPELSRLTGRSVYLKLENLQLTGSFKVRGALYALGRSQGSTGGILTCSAGNHGLGVAHAAAELGVEALVCVPSSVDPAKREGLERRGVQVRMSPFSGFDDTETWSIELASQLGLRYLSAYDDPFVMAGNGGSLALEIFDQCPDVATIVVPVGGGGMAGGIVAASVGLGREMRLVAAQLASSPALARSLELGEAVTRMPPAETLAGGLEGGLGRLPFEILKDHTDRVVLVDEAGVWSGVRWMLKHHGLLIEPSSAVAIDACLRLADAPAPGPGPAPDPALAPGPVVVVVSGRNVAASTVHRIVTEPA